MGNSEEGKLSKSEKACSASPMDQTTQANPTNVQMYPDWAAMQAYYGPRVAVPPYYNSTMASGHAPHPYMWGPPHPMMPPYAAPYAAIYSHGSVYAHPAVSHGPHAQVHGVPSSPSVKEALTTPLKNVTPTKSLGNTNQGLMKKLKGFDALAMSIGNGSSEDAAGGTEHSVETEASSDGSYEITAGAGQTQKKRSREGTPTTDKDEKSKTQANVVTSRKSSAVSKAAKSMGPTASPGMSMALELRNSTGATPASVPVLPTEAWSHNDRELKREKRKQSNRESARRSRLRKQAETEELARKVESLIAENEAIKSEINRLTESSDNLKEENTTLSEKLKNSRTGQKKDVSSSIEDKRQQPEIIDRTRVKSRVNNSSDVAERSIDDESNMYKKNPNSGTKLGQLLSRSPRADAVVAG